MGVQEENTLYILGRLLGGAKKRKKKTYTKPKKQKHKHKKIKLRVLKFYKVRVRRIGNGRGAGTDVGVLVRWYRQRSFNVCSHTPPLGAPSNLVCPFVSSDYFCTLCHLEGSVRSPPLLLSVHLSLLIQGVNMSQHNVQLAVSHQNRRGPWWSHVNSFGTCICIHCSRRLRLSALLSMHSRCTGLLSFSSITEVIKFHANHYRGKTKANAID